MNVESQVPIPRKYPFADMKVGDSFIIPESVNRATVYVAAKRYGTKHGVKFTVRLDFDRNLRCWRIE